MVRIVHVCHDLEGVFAGDAQLDHRALLFAEFKRVGLDVHGEVIGPFEFRIFDASHFFVDLHLHPRFG